MGRRLLNETVFSTYGHIFDCYRLATFEADGVAIRNDASLVAIIFESTGRIEAHKKIERGISLGALTCYRFGCLSSAFSSFLERSMTW